jgi:predicted dehydrogenase
MNNRRVKWGIIGTGGIARTYAAGVSASDSGELVAVGSRDEATAKAFAEKNGVPRAYGSYPALLADPDVEAVYISTPHPMHAEWAVRAAEAGKHILCEKPIGMNRREAEMIFAAAKKAGVLVMEAFMYRCHPQTAKAIELIRGGALGTVGSIQATFSFNNNSGPDSRFWSKALGGGGILDVGCYPVSFSRLVAGAIVGKPFANPTEVKALGKLHPQTGVDVVTSAVMRFDSGLLAQVSTGVGLFQESTVRVFGSEGWLHVVEPWLPSTSGRSNILVFHREGRGPEQIEVAPPRPLYALEADAFARALRAGASDVPEMSRDDTLGNLAAMDAWRAEIGLTYPADSQRNS